VYAERVNLEKQGLVLLQKILKPALAHSSKNMVKKIVNHAGSKVARSNKFCADRLPLRMTVKKQLGCQKQLYLTEWNVRTLIDRATSNRPERQTASITKELSRYRVDIAALSETCLASYGSLVDGQYTFFWSGKSKEERRDSGVGFSIRNTIMHLLKEDPSPVSDRIMSMRLPLKKNAYATIVSVYAPTMTNSEDTKEAFYSQLRNVLSKICKKDKLILAEDFNARVGCDQDNWEGVIDKHDTGKCNSNGELLLALCSEYELVITNTVFKHKEHHKVIWMHPRSKHWHLLDYVITRKKNQNGIKHTKVMRGTDCGTDYQMVGSCVGFSVRKTHNRKKVKPLSNLDTRKSKEKKHRLNWSKKWTEH